MSRVDRTGQEYNGSIIPDVFTLNPEQEAVDWLLEQSSCTKQKADLPILS